MKLAVPQWQGRVSPVFDSAGEFLLLEAVEGWQVRREVVRLVGKEPLEKARSLQQLGVQLLICGAISHPMEAAVAGTGIEVIPNTCGKVEDVLQAFLNGRLNEKMFRMPGARRRKVGGSTAHAPHG